jgi:Zn-dependent protease with chaperone function
MNFFARQAEARALSRRFFVLFVLAVLVVVGAVSACVISVLAAFQKDSPLSRGSLLPDAQWLTDHAGLVTLVTLGVFGVIAVASTYRTSQLHGGGGAVARSAGGSRVPNETADPDQRRLLNVVEEIAIASGVPVPAVYVLEHEPGINAFAAGYNPSNAAIAVTRGCLELLDRDELQGVIAHEFSHIVNGDMRLSIRMVGMLFGLMAIAGIARTVLRIAPRTRDERGGVFVVFFIAVFVYLIGCLGLFLGRMIQAAVSRKRESLADASAVQFTRDTHGLRDALVKIGASTRSSRLVEADADAVAHMLFAPGMTRLFATHPPLLERIRALDPRFDPAEFAQVRAAMAEREGVRAAPAARTDTGAERLDRLLSAAIPLDPGGLSQQVGQPAPAHIALAHAIRVSLPDAVLSAASDVRSAQALLLALAVDERDDIRDQQLRFVANQLGEPLAQASREWIAVADQLNPMQRQPALLRLLPTLRQLPAVDRVALLNCLNGLLQRGGRVSMAQYSLRKLAQVYLRDVAVTAWRPKALPLAQARNDAALLLATLAQYGHEDIAEAQASFQRGMQRLFPQSPVAVPVPENWPAQLDAAFNRLDRLAPADKEKLLEAMALTVIHDGKVFADEAELLRATSAILHCPLPPLIETT